MGAYIPIIQDTPKITEKQGVCGKKYPANPLIDFDESNAGELLSGGAREQGSKGAREKEKYTSAIIKTNLADY